MSAVKQTVRHFTKKHLFTIIFIGLGLLSYVMLAKASQKSLRKDIESPYHWGKGVGPIQVRLDEKSKSGNTVTLEGSILTKFTSFHVKWKLPEGATLVSGQLEEDVTRDPAERVVTKTIKVKSSSAMSSKHVVFFVYTQDSSSSEKLGMTAVYNLQETEESKEKTEKIQQLMKARNVVPIK